jgi:hypothetical protein
LAHLGPGDPSFMTLGKHLNFPMPFLLIYLLAVVMVPISWGCRDG